jgi:outer membrane protein assembly factor BamB
MGSRSNANTPVFAGGRLYATDKDRSYCLDATTKTVLWTGPKPGDAKPSAILADGKVLFGGRGKGALTVVAAADGRPLYQTELGMAGCTSFVLVDGRLLVNGGTHLRCYDLAKH